MGNKPRQYPRKILLAFFAFCLAILFAEIVLRLFDYTYLPLRIEFREGAEDHRRYHAFQDHFFVYDPERFWKPKIDCSVFNSQGFRGKVLSANKRPTEFRIFTIGDSNTLGWEDGANWPGSLARILFRQDPECAVVNAGVYGYTSLQGLRHFEQVLPYQPDMVLVSFGGNDAHSVLMSDKEFHANPSERLLLNSRIGHLLLAAHDQLTLAGKERSDQKLVPRVSLEEYRDCLREFIRLSKENNVQCVFLTRPWHGTSTAANCWKTHAPDYRTATIEVARENNVPLIDIHAYFKEKDTDVYFADESHFTQKGHDLAARIIAEKLKLLLPPADPPQ